MLDYLFSFSTFSLGMFYKVLLLNPPWRIEKQDLKENHFPLTKSKQIEFIQYLNPVGAGPSSNT